MKLIHDFFQCRSNLHKQLRLQFRSQTLWEFDDSLFSQVYVQTYEPLSSQLQKGLTRKK